MTAPIRIDVERRFPVSVHDGFDYITDPGHWPEYWPAWYGSTLRRAGAGPATGPVSFSSCVTASWSST
jgi:uncharacterized protein YndB with AHSA1/START domain